MKISTIVLSKNCERTLEDTLMSVSFSDEIILIDAGSEDRTLEIAKRYRCKIYTCKEHDFSYLRNLGNKLAKNPWILHVDSDEIITDELKNEIIFTIENSSFSRYLIPRITFVNKRPMSIIYPDYQCRLLNKYDGTCYSRRIHEIFAKDGLPISLLPHGKLTNPIIHVKQNNNSVLTRIFKIPSELWMTIDEAITIAGDDYYNFVAVRNGMEILHEKRSRVHLLDIIKRIAQSKPKSSEEVIWLFAFIVFNCVHQFTLNILKLKPRS